MKYHSPASTIIISLIVLVLFVAVAFFAVLSIGMTSPTLIVAELLMDDMRHAGSDISVSFESIERNLRDGIFINELEIGYRGEDVLTLDRVTVRMGILQLIRFALSGEGRLDIVGEGASFTLPSSIGGDGKQEERTAPAIPQVFSSHPVALHLEGISVDAGFFRTPDAAVSIFLDEGIGLEAAFNEASVSAAGTDISISGFEAKGALRDGISVSASAESISAVNERYSALLSSPVFNASLPEDRDTDGFEAGLSFSSLQGSYDEAAVSIGSSTLSVSGHDAAALIQNAYASYGDASVSIASISAELADDSVSADISNADVLYRGTSLYSSGGTSVSFSLESHALSLISSALSSEALNLMGFPFSTEGNDLKLTASPDEGAELSGSVRFLSEDSVVSGTAVDFLLSASQDEGLSLMISDLHLPGVDEGAELLLSWNDGSLSADGSFGDYLSFSASYGKGMSARALMSALPLHPFLPFIEAYAPVLYNYIGSGTKLSGSFSFSADEEMEGGASFALALSDILFTGRPFSIGAAGNGQIHSDRIDIGVLSLTSDFVRASFEGSIGFSTLIPEGRFMLSMTGSGSEIFSAELTLTGDKECSFLASAPYFQPTSFSGSVNWEEEDMIEAVAVLSGSSFIYPFDIAIDLASKSITLNNERVHSEVSFGEDFIGTIDFDGFRLPSSADPADAPFIDGSITASFDFAEQQLRIDSPLFTIGSIRRLPGSPDISFSIEGDNENLFFNDLTATADGFETLEGRFALEYRLPRIALSLQGESGERLLLSIVRSDDGMFSGLMRSDHYDLGRFGLESMIGDVNLTARAGTWEALSFSGSISAYSRDMINDPAVISADLYIDSDEIALSGLTYSNGNLSITSDGTRFDSDTGLLRSSIEIQTVLEKVDGPVPVTASLSLTASLAKGGNLADSAMSLVRTGLEGMEGSIHLSDVNLGNLLYIDQRDLNILYSGGEIDLSGSLASGFIDIETGTISVYADLMPAAALLLEGSFGNGDTELRFVFDSFEISIANLFLTPTVPFYPPSIAHGEIIAVLNGVEWDIFGSLQAEEVAFDVFWMPGQRIILHNPVFNVWNGSFVSLVDDCTVLDLETYERTYGRVSLTMDLSPTLVFGGWQVDVYVDESTEVGIRLPLASSNVDIWGDVNGHLTVGQGTDGILYLNGVLNASDLTMSIGMAPMPDWMLESGADTRTTADLDLMLTDNVKFVFPLTGDPILRADIAENQHLRVIVDKQGDLDVSGSLGIRSGEIFYFQKNFYITEGNIGFMPVLAEESGFNPVINLRARLRDFDADGNPVDIYLNLLNSTLDNLSPTFDSSPSKPLSEIMQILGQSILPTEMYDGFSISSMVSLVSASVDILSRFGLLGTTDGNTLEDSIRSSLALDTFSLHTNIIENLIFDTVSYASSDFGDEAVSPMARYLDGTTLYLGKYLSPELYLEGMVHLNAEKNLTETSHTFLADDLNLDIEVSLEWDTPMALFTVFTRPENITLYDIIDRFGFGFSKRIVW